MARNTSAIKRGWSYDSANSRLDAFVNGVLVFSIDGANTRLLFDDDDIMLGDNDYIQFGDASGGDVNMRWNGSLFQVLPAADDTGYVAIGNGTLDLDFKVYLSHADKYALFDVGNAYFTLEDVDLRLGDNDSIQFGDGILGGDVTAKWNGSLLQILPTTDDTGYVSVGDGSTDMDFKVYLGTVSKYALFDVGNVYFTLEDVDMRLGDNDSIQFGDGVLGGDVTVKWNGSLLQILPTTDDTGYIGIGDGSTDMDMRIYLGTVSKYALFDVGEAYFWLEDVDMRLGDNDVLQFGDASGGDVRANWNGSLLQILPAVNDTGYVAIGNASTDMDFKVYAGGVSNYFLIDVGNQYLDMTGLSLLAPNLATSAGQAGIIYVDSNGYLIQSD